MTGQWGNHNLANNAPSWPVDGGFGSTANGQAMFDNTSPSAFVAGRTDGVFGANTGEVAANPKIAHAGWLAVRSGTGPVKDFLIANGGVGFANGETGHVSGGTTNATFSLTTDANGTITGVSIGAPGAGFQNVASAVVTLPNDGEILTYTINAGGTLYANTDLVSVSNGSVNATAHVVTDGSGVITSLTPILNGRGFDGNVAHAVVTITTSTGSAANVAVASFSAATANLVPILGGRAGIVSIETLIATKLQGASPHPIP